MKEKEIKKEKEIEKYVPNYPTFDIEKQSNVVNVSGHSPRECVAIEEESQREVAESEKWLIARNLINFRGGADKDSYEELEKLGFTMFVVYDELFYSCTQPKGWTKETEGYWTKIKDEKGVERISQFYKGAFYDRSAHISIVDVKTDK